MTILTLRPKVKIVTNQSLYITLFRTRQSSQSTCLAILWTALPLRTTWILVVCSNSLASIIVSVRGIHRVHSIWTCTPLSAKRILHHLFAVTSDQWYVSETQILPGSTLSETSVNDFLLFTVTFSFPFLHARGYLRHDPTPSSQFEICSLYPSAEYYLRDYEATGEGFVHVVWVIFSCEIGWFYFLCIRWHRWSEESASFADRSSAFRSVTWPRVLSAESWNKTQCSAVYLCL